MVPSAHDIIQANVQFRSYSNFPPRPVVVTSHTPPPSMMATPVPARDLEVLPKQEAAVEPVELPAHLRRRLFAGLIAASATATGFSELPLGMRVVLFAIAVVTVVIAAV
jgi:hypothetical protein